MLFFFTTPKSTSRPSIENMFRLCLKMSRLKNANGTVSGRELRMMPGYSHDSNCAARIRYMKMKALLHDGADVVVARPGRGVGEQGDLALPPVAIDARRTLARLPFHDRAERHAAVFGRRHAHQ